jgi:SAM-dependent methyltransferase
MISIFKKIPVLRQIYLDMNNLYQRDKFVKESLSKIPSGHKILDVGCGSQQFKKYCSHLIYKAQDFGQYEIDQKKMLGAESGGLGSGLGYQYGRLDYVGDCWEIKEVDGAFDAILCTEVFEHIPYPIETLEEFSRLLKEDGILILTAPSNCLRHMDPYFFYSGFSDRWHEKFMAKTGFQIKFLEPVGDYYSWMSVELARTAMTHSFLSKLLILPAFFYFYLKKKTEISTNTLCMGYHVIARKVAIIE